MSDGPETTVMRPEWEYQVIERIFSDAMDLEKYLNYVGSAEGGCWTPTGIHFTRMMHITATIVLSRSKDENWPQKVKEAFAEGVKSE